MVKVCSKITGTVQEPLQDVQQIHPVWEFPSTTTTVWVSANRRQPIKTDRNKHFCIPTAISLLTSRSTALLIVILVLRSLVHDCPVWWFIGVFFVFTCVLCAFMCFLCLCVCVCVVCVECIPLLHNKFPHWGQIKFLNLDWFFVDACHQLPPMINLIWILQSKNLVIVINGTLTYCFIVLCIFGPEFAKKICDWLNVSRITYKGHQPNLSVGFWICLYQHTLCCGAPPSLPQSSSCLSMKIATWCRRGKKPLALCQITNTPGPVPAMLQY